MSHYYVAVWRAALRAFFGWPPQRIDGWIETLLAQDEPWELLWDGETILGAGGEFERLLEAVVATETGQKQVIWTERVQVFRSLCLLRQQSDHLDGQLARAEKALWALTPVRRRRAGRRRSRGTGAGSPGRALRHVSSARPLAVASAILLFDEPVRPDRSV